MKYAIWGIGAAGKHVSTQVRARGETDIDFISSVPDAEYINGIKVFKAAEYLRSKRPDVYIIAAGSQIAVFEILSELIEAGTQNIYILEDIAGKKELDLFEKNGGVIGSRLHKISYPYAGSVLPYIEIPIVDDCNLNCKGCVFGCNKNTDNKYMDAALIEKDLRRLRELFKEVVWIRVLGGEPMLHPQLSQVLKIIREIFPETEIDLCTNGILIPSSDENLFNTINENNISVHISGYPPVMSHRDKISKILDIKKIQYTFLSRDRFFKFYGTDREHNITDSHSNCPTRGCPELYYGKILKCSAVIAFERFNKYFNTNYEITNDDYLSIYDPNLTGKSIIKFLSNPAPMCAYCDTNNITYYSWEAGRRTPELNDYVIS